MGGHPCIRGMRVTVGVLVGLLAVECVAHDVMQTGGPAARGHARRDSVV